jgi:hypothetical protein
MKWSYFKNARGLNEKKYFEKRKLLSKNEIKGFLDKNNFTYSENELQIIYDTVLPKEKPEVKKQETKKLEGKKSVLPQKKKRVRNSSKRKRHVSGSLDK